MLGIGFALLAALGWGMGAVFARLGLQYVKVTTGTFISLVASLLLTGSITLLVRFDELASISFGAILWFFMIGVINFPLGRRFNYMGIHYVGVGRATPIFSSSPLFALTIAVAFTNETVTPLIVLGTALVVSGLWLLVSGNRNEPKQPAGL